jgi:hypothetical protein
MALRAVKVELAAAWHFPRVVGCIDNRLCSCIHTVCSMNTVITLVHVPTFDESIVLMRGKSVVVHFEVGHLRVGRSNVSKS